MKRDDHPFTSRIDHGYQYAVQGYDPSSAICGIWSPHREIDGALQYLAWVTGEIKAAGAWVRVRTYAIGPGARRYRTLIALKRCKRGWVEA